MPGWERWTGCNSSPSQLLERSRALRATLIDDDDLAVDEAGAHLKFGHCLDDLREAAGEMMSVARVEPHATGAVGCLIAGLAIFRNEMRFAIVPGAAGSALAQQLRQLGDVHRNPSRLILAEQLGR